MQQKSRRFSAPEALQCVPEFMGFQQWPQLQISVVRTCCLSQHFTPSAVNGCVAERALHLDSVVDLTLRYDSTAVLYVQLCIMVYDIYRASAH